MVLKYLQIIWGVARKQELTRGKTFDLQV